MMPKWDSYSAMGWIGIFTVPLAPAFFFAWDIFTEVMGKTGGIVALAVAVAIAAAVGLEVVGILAGHNAIEFWKRKERESAIAAGVIMVCYTAIGMYQLRGTTGAIMFLVAPMVYILVALRHNLGEEKTAEKQQVNYDRRVEAQEREHRQRLEAAQLKLKHEERMEQIKAKATTPVAQIVAMQQPQATTETTKKERMMSLWQPGMGATELARRAGVNKSTASRYINNGAMKHYQMGDN